MYMKHLKFTLFDVSKFCELTAGFLHSLWYAV